MSIQNTCALVDLSNLSIVRRLFVNSKLVFVLSTVSPIVGAGMRNRVESVDREAYSTPLNCKLS